MGLRRLVACGDLLGAWIPDNYVPIKFNDCPLFRSTNARVSVLSPFCFPLPLLLSPTPMIPILPSLPRSYWCATESATTIIRIAIQLLFNIIGARLESSCLCGNVARTHYKTTKKLPLANKCFRADCVPFSHTSLSEAICSPRLSPSLSNGIKCQRPGPREIGSLERNLLRSIA